MELDAAKKYLNILFDHIFDLLFINRLGVNHAEYVFVRVLEQLKDDVCLKEWFIQHVRYNLLMEEQDMTKLGRRPNWFVDPDLILFIAHATRWREFREIAEERKSKLHTIKTLCNEREFSDEVLQALNDDWEDRDFYKTFGS